MDLYYVTGNAGKFEQVSLFLKHAAPHINLIQHDIDMTEIQTLDQEAIARDKATQAWNLLEKPLIIDDTGFYFDKYNQFPGTLAKFVYEGIGMEGLLKLVTPGDKAHFLLYLIFVDADGAQHLFESTVGGEVFVGSSTHPKLSYNGIFKPNGSDKSYHELYGTPEGEKFFPRIRAMQQLVDWLRLK